MTVSATEAVKHEEEKPHRIERITGDQGDTLSTPNAKRGKNFQILFDSKEILAYYLYGRHAQELS